MLAPEILINYRSEYSRNKEVSIIEEWLGLQEPQLV